ncbi:MAG TPA: hypothetical protein VJB65_04420, partial [Patescibacteria group bacterium]|nr:hypothetical protein [Patescibacteria group bacterium]
MTDINFIPTPEHSSQKPIRHRDKEGDIEYTSGEPQKNVPVKSQKLSKSARASKPQEKKSFLSWRKQKNPSKDMHPGSIALPDDSPDLLHSSAYTSSHSASALHTQQPTSSITRVQKKSSVAKSMVKQQQSNPPKQHIRTMLTTENQVKTPLKKPLLFGVNLLPPTYTVHGKNIRSLRLIQYIGIGAFVIIACIFFGMKWYQQQLQTDTKQIQDEMRVIESEIFTLQPAYQSAHATQKQLEETARVINSHIYWTPFLHLVEQLTLPTVYYQSMSGSAATGEFEFEVKALDYSSIELQTAVFRNSPQVISVEVTSAIQTGSTNNTKEQKEGIQSTMADASTISFSLSVQFQPTVFQNAVAVDQLNNAP